MNQNEEDDFEIIEKKSINNYIDNIKFCKAMTEWKKIVVEAENCADKRPPISNYIAECFIKIAEHLSHRPNFINYPFREDMVGDGVENCLLYAHNFDPSKSSNPFSYFTQIIYYAFLRRIEKEKKQSYIKFKCMQMTDVDGKFVDWLNKSDSSSYSDFIQKNFSLSENDLAKLSEREQLKAEKKNRKKRK